MNGSKEEGDTGLPPKPPTFLRQLSGQRDTSEDAEETGVGEAARLDSRPSLLRQCTPQFEVCEEDATVAANGSGKKSSASTSPSWVFDLRIGAVTDPGGAPGNRTNQDDYFVWKSPYKDDGEPGTTVIAVFDGHGRELGQLASEAARKSFFRDLTDTETLERVRTSPRGTMSEVFARANANIRDAFQAFYESRGMEVQREAEGYLCKRRRGASRWSGSFLAGFPARCCTPSDFLHLYNSL